MVYKDRVKYFEGVDIMTTEFLETKSMMLEFYDAKGIKIPKHFNRVLALVMLDVKYGIDNLHAIKRVYNRIRHCRHTMLVSTVQALDILEDSYTYTPDFNCVQLEYTIDNDNDDYTIGTLDGITAKRYALEQSANALVDKINNETLTNNLFQSMPETRYNAIKITVATLLSYYDRELKGTISTLDVTSEAFNKLTVEVKEAILEQRKKEIKDFKKAKKSRQEKIRTYLFRWYGIKASVNYSFCIALWESMQKFESGYYTE